MGFALALEKTILYFFFPKKKNRRADGTTDADWSIHLRRDQIWGAGNMASFEVETRVLTRRNDALEDLNYYPGVIAQVNSDGTYDIMCDDGDSFYYVVPSLFYLETQGVEALSAGVGSISLATSQSPSKASNEDYFGDIMLTDTLKATDKKSCQEYGAKLVRNYLKQHPDAPVELRQEILRLFVEAMTGFVPESARSRLAMLEKKVKHLDTTVAGKHKATLAELDKQLDDNLKALLADAESKESHFAKQQKTLGTFYGYWSNSRFLPATSVELGKNHFRIIGEIHLEMKRMSDHHAELVAKRMAVYVLSEQDAEKAKQKRIEKLGFDAEA